MHVGTIHGMKRPIPAIRRAVCDSTRNIEYLGEMVAN